MNLREALGKKFIIFDGAMGTMLQRKGLKLGDIPEELNITNPQIIEDIHTEYIKAGADIITTNTFGANSLKLRNSKYSTADIITKAVEIAKKSSEGKLVALDIGPIGRLFEPLGDIEFNHGYEIFKEQIIYGSKAGADLILIETMSDIYEAKAAILAAKDNCDLPIICTMTFDKNGRTLTGTDPLTMVTILEGLAVDALGVNCSFGPKDILPIVEEVLKYSSIPVLVQPNAGLPTMSNNDISYYYNHNEFTKYIEEMAQVGASIFGGCCGTSPEYINAVKKSLEGKNPTIRNVNKATSAASSTRTIILENDITVIGERINPTGKEKLETTLSSGDFSVVIEEAIAQNSSGADILDINVGLPGVDETETMIRAIKEIQKVVDIPLQIDSIKPEVLEKAARIYNGKPIINSINGKESIMQKIFPIVKRYGACVIALTLDEKGIPSTAQGRAKIAKKILDTAKQYGIPKENIIIDCLVLSAATNQDEITETLKAVKLVKERYGVKTILGISNISYGFPNRQVMNRVFLSMALSWGLDAAIIDPLDKGVIETISAFKVLSNKDKNGMEYLSIMSPDYKDSTTTDKATRDLKDMIIIGLEEEAYLEVQRLVENIEPLRIVDEYIIPALDVVGENYDSGSLHLPHLIQSAKTVNRIFKVIRTHLVDERESYSYYEKILLATVEGDIHDIGKNIVKMLLENHGYEVIDLGVDVSIERIIKKVNQHNIKLVGLSALTTTTLGSMKETIRRIKKECSSCTIMVGGAVLSEEYSKTIKADYYASNAKDAVRIAKEVLM